MCRSPTASQEDEEVEEGNSLSKHGRELQRLLKTTGLSESDDDPSNEVKSVLQMIDCLPCLCMTIAWKVQCCHVLPESSRLHTCA